MNDDAFIRAAHKMVNYGGSFAAAIAQAYFVADLRNRAKLRLEFDDLFRS